MPDQPDFLATDLDPELIQSRARADASRIRAAYRRRGRRQAIEGEAKPAQVRAYLDALREILGGSKSKL